MEWRTLKVGDKVTYVTDEFDGYFEADATVKEVYEDHIIVDCPTISDHLWIEDFNADLIK